MPHPSPTDSPPLSPAAVATVVQDTQRWVERAVIGLNLCPFAKAPQAKGQIHYVVYPGFDAQALWQQLHAELLALAHAAPDERETTLLMAPRMWPDFLDFNDALAEAEEALHALDLTGTIQIAPFHPQFVFAGTAADDITNATNRAPYPTLHLLREASIDRAVAAFPDAESIYGANMQRLRALGDAGWAALGVHATLPSSL